jgi:hypothetical protein
VSEPGAFDARRLFLTLAHGGARLDLDVQVSPGGRSTITGAARLYEVSD